MTFPTFTLPAAPVPTGYQIRVGGALRSRVFETYDAAFNEAVDDYEIVPVEGE
jgi:hypothetical protein